MLPLTYANAEVVVTIPVFEERIVHLYELDPTHAVAVIEESVEDMGERSARSPAERFGSHSSLIFFILDEEPMAGPLLELDPVHF